MAVKRCVLHVRESGGCREQGHIQGDMDIWANIGRLSGLCSLGPYLPGLHVLWRRLCGQVHQSLSKYVLIPTANIMPLHFCLMKKHRLKWLKKTLGTSWK